MNNVQKIIEERFGRGSAFLLSDMKERRNSPENTFSVKSKLLNQNLSGDYRCGIPRGRVTEIYGPEQSGKTTLALTIVSEVNKLGFAAAYIDAEFGLDVNYAKSIGVNPDLFYLSQPDCGEDAFEIAHEYLNDENIKILVFDSVASLTPRSEIEGTMDDQGMGNHARLMGKGLRKLIPVLAKTRAAAVFINQIRSKIGSYGNPETTTGGKALKFYSWVRMEVRAPRSGAVVEKEKMNIEEELKQNKELEKQLRGKTRKEKKKILRDLKKETKKSGGLETGIESNIKIVKNKIYPPYRECTLNIIYGKGIDVADDTIRFLADRNILTIDGAKVNYHGNQMLRRSFMEKMQDKEFKKKIKQEVNACQKL